VFLEKENGEARIAASGLFTSWPLRKRAVLMLPFLSDCANMLGLHAICIGDAVNHHHNAVTVFFLFVAHGTQA